MPRHTAPKPHVIDSWELHHGITLSIDHLKPLHIEAIENFLALAMEHFKGLRDNEHLQIFPDRSWTRDVIEGRHIIGIGTLTGKTAALPTDAWVKALITAYTNANTLSQIKEQFEIYKAQADGWLAGVVAALEKKNGDAEAFELMMQRERERPSL
jgi:hypothetical protein